MSTVIGLDLSLTATGWAWVDADETGAATITTTAKEPMGDRLDHITTMVMRDSGAVIVDLIVIEDLPTHAHGAGRTGMVHGAVRLALYRDRFREGANLLTVPPATLKVFATGKGNATKADMRVALLQRTGTDVRDDNQVDAIFLAHLGHAWLGTPLLDLPKTHTRAFDKLPGRAVVGS